MSKTTVKALFPSGGKVLAVNMATLIDAFTDAPVPAPATAGATGIAGQWAYDANYIYICTATNTWKRAAIATW